MPLYEYKCTSPTCLEEFEVLQKASDPDPECPKCHSNQVLKQLSKGYFGFVGGSPTGSRPGL